MQAPVVQDPSVQSDWDVWDCWDVWDAVVLFPVELCDATLRVSASPRETFAAAALALGLYAAAAICASWTNAVV